MKIDLNNIPEILSFLPDGVEIHETYDECTCCGKRVNYVEETITKVMIQGLIKLYHFGGSAKIAHLNLSNTLYNNFQKLQYFGLIMVSGKSVWTITELGKRFLRGEEPCPHKVFRRGKLILEKQGLVFIEDIVDLEYVNNREYFEDQIRNQVE